MPAVEHREHAAVAREAIEQVCTHGDWDRARRLYADDFVDHVNAMEFRGQDGVRESVSLYRRLFPDLSLTVEDQVEEGDRVASRWFVLKKRASILLHALLPRWYVPLYTMVEFTRIPYAKALRRARRQGAVVRAAGVGLALLLLGLLWWALRG